MNRAAPRTLADVRDQTSVIRGVRPEEHASGPLRNATGPALRLGRAHCACLALLLQAVACRRAPAHPPAASEAADQATAAALPDGRWQIQPLVVELELVDDQIVAGLDEATVTREVLAALRSLPQVLATEPTATTYLGSNQAGVEVSVRWQLFDADGKPRGVEAEPVDGALVLAVGVHAEQAVLHGRGEMAEHLFRATLPLPARRQEPLDAFLKARLASALQPAASQALGELWARQLPEDAVVDLLTDDEDWRKVVGAREVGERKLVRARVALEGLARSSKRDLAVVAAAALGRLGDARSVPVLVSCVDSGHLDVVDAALQALADMPAPEAQAALKAIAEGHGESAVRLRAADLLRARHAPKPTSK